MAERMTVLNDVIEVGDRVAVAVGDGKYGSGMRTGTVLEIIKQRGFDGGWKRQEVKLRVEQTSGTSWGGVPYIKTFDSPMRMVKLGSVVSGEE